MFAELYQRLFGFYWESAEQRYQSLMKRCPDLQEKLSLKEIAQFHKVLVMVWFYD